MEISGRGGERWDQRAARAQGQTWELLEAVEGNVDLVLKKIHRKVDTVLHTHLLDWSLPSWSSHCRVAHGLCSGHRNLNDPKDHIQILLVDLKMN